MPEPPVVLLGATGYTGRLVLRRFEESGIACTLAGRGRAELARLAHDHEVVRSVHAVDVTDPGTLAWLENPELIVASCVGPFQVLGLEVVRAVARGGGRYVDVSGEEPFVAFARETCTAVAERSGALIVQACAFESFPADMLAASLCAPGESLKEVASYYAIDGHRVSPGTALTMRLAGHWVTSVYEDGAFVPRAPGSRVRSIALPFLPARSHAVFAPYPEIRFWPTQLDTRNASSWIAVGPTEARLAGVKKVAAERSVERIMERHRARKRPGPSELERADQDFSIAVVATDDAGGARAQFIEGHDPYGLTASILTWVVQRLAAGDGSGLAGVRSPSEVFDPDAFRTAASGWDVGLNFGLAEGSVREWVEDRPDRR